MRIAFCDVKTVTNGWDADAADDRLVRAPRRMRGTVVDALRAYAKLLCADAEVYRKTPGHGKIAEETEARCDEIHDLIRMVEE